MYLTDPILLAGSVYPFIMASLMRQKLLVTFSLVKISNFSLEKKKKRSPD